MYYTSEQRRTDKEKSKEETKVDVLLGIAVLAYIPAAWWAANRVWYSKRTYFVTDSAAFYGKKFATVFCLGWIFIPIAIIQKVISSKK